MDETEDENDDDIESPSEADDDNNDDDASDEVSKKENDDDGSNDQANGEHSNEDEHAESNVSDYMTGDEDTRDGTSQREDDPDYEPEETIIQPSEPRLTRATSRGAFPNPFRFNFLAEPVTIKEATKGPQAAEWRKAVKEEMSSHADNHT